VRCEREDGEHIERPVDLDFFSQKMGRHLTQAEVEHHRIFAGVVVRYQLAHGSEACIGYCENIASWQA